MGIRFSRCRRLDPLALPHCAKRPRLSELNFSQAPMALPGTRNAMVTTTAGQRAMLPWSSNAALTGGLRLGGSGWPPHGLVRAPRCRRKGRAQQHGVRDLGIQIEGPTREDTLLASILYGDLYDINPIVGARCSIV